jgi:hypothetical protein
MSWRIVSSNESGSDSKASMTSGSKWRPLSPTMMSRACAIDDAARYGRVVVSASSVSATANTRADSGMFAPARPSG